MHDLKARVGPIVVEAAAVEHLLRVEGPSLDEDAVVVVAADGVGMTVGDRDLKVVPGDPLVGEDRPGVLDRRPQEEVHRLRVVGRNEVET